MRLVVGVAGITLALMAPCPRADYVSGQRALQRGDPQLAYREFAEAAESGDVEAARKLGFILGHGLEFRGGGRIEARPEEAAKWFRVGADHGDRICAEALGAMLAVGRGLPLDTAEAVRRFEQAGRSVGREIPPELASLGEPDRIQIATWFVATQVVMQREMKRIRHPGESGDVVLRIHAEPPQVSLNDGLAPKVAEYMEAYGKEILALAPPPPAARKAKITQEFRYSFH